MIWFDPRHQQQPALSSQPTTRPTPAVPGDAMPSQDQPTFVPYFTESVQTKEAQSIRFTTVRQPFAGRAGEERFPGSTARRTRSPAIHTNFRRQTHRGNQSARSTPQPQVGYPRPPSPQEIPDQSLASSSVSASAAFSIVACIPFGAASYSGSGTVRSSRTMPTSVDHSLPASHTLSQPNSHHPHTYLRTSPPLPQPHRALCKPARLRLALPPSHHAQNFLQLPVFPPVRIPARQSQKAGRTPEKAAHAMASAYGQVNHPGRTGRRLPEQQR